MVKHTQTIRRQIADELFVFDHFSGLALKGLRLALKGLRFKTYHEIETKNLSSFLADIYLSKVNNGNTRVMCEICSKLTIKTPERCR